MSIGECPSPRPDCKYFPECFSDEDHLIPKRLGRTALEKLYLTLPQYRVQICRDLHDERNARHDAGDLSDIPPFPERVDMVEEIREAEVHIPTRLRSLFEG